MSLQTLLAEVSEKNLRTHVEYIARTCPTRLAGSQGAGRMAAYSARMLNEAGAAGQVNAMNALVSFPGPGKLTLPDGNGARSVDAWTCAHSPSTGPGGLAAELVDVDGGASADWQRVEASGKIVLADLAKGPARIEKMRVAMAHGARGLVTLNWGTHDGNALPWGSVKPAWGTPVPATWCAEMADIPAIGVGRHDGLWLKERLRHGPLPVKLHAQADNGWRTLHFTTGEIRGAGDDFVIVGGHQDAWYGEQATDNATGSACLLELARIFGKLRPRPERGLVFGFWAGHETGTMASSTYFVDQHWDRLREHAVAYLQIDQPGCAGTTRWSSASNTELMRMQKAIDATMMADRPRSWRRSPKIGDASFFGLGVPMLAGLGSYTEAELAATANAAFGWWHHTSANTLDKVDWASLAAHLRVYVAWLWTLCTTPVLPFDFVSVAELVEKRLAAIDETVPELHLKPVGDTARQLRRLAQRLDAVVTAINQASAQGQATGDARAQRLNGCIKRLSRLLLPIESTAAGKYGQDPYAFTPQSTVLPALFDATALAAMKPGTGEREMLETQLIRARNWIHDALLDACEVIERVL